MSRFAGSFLCFVTWLGTIILTQYVEPHLALARLVVNLLLAFSALGLLVSIVLIIRWAGRYISRTPNVFGSLLGAMVIFVAGGVGLMLLAFLLLTLPNQGDSNDVCIYRDPGASYHKLILQQYNWGFTGNSDYRLIEVWNEQAAFRRYRNVAARAVRGRIPGFNVDLNEQVDATIYFRSLPFRLEREPDYHGADF